MKISKIIVKKLNGTVLSESENTFFEKWFLDSESNRELFAYYQSYRNDGGDISKLGDWDTESAWSKVIAQSPDQKDAQVQEFKWKSILKYAAIFIGVVLLAQVFYMQVFNAKEKVAANPDAITLELENGELLIIAEDDKFNITNNGGEIIGSKDEDEISYKDTNGADKLIFNKLTVPYGKTFKVELSDGTKVHLNAGTSLRYPVKFIKGEPRNVRLVGEAYFEVAKDSEHPFIVSMSKMDIRVYGTRFNVSAYPEDQFISTVLVEGSVGLAEPGSGDVKSEKDVVALVPGQKADWNVNVMDGEVSIESVDTNIYTEWMEGRIVLKKVSFTNVLKKLERHFNVEIENRYTELNEEVFTVSFDIEGVEEILASFAENKGFEFTINDRKIVIEKPN